MLYLRSWTLQYSRSVKYWWNYLEIKINYPQFNSLLYNIIIVVGGAYIKDKNSRSIGGGLYAVIKITNPLKQGVVIHEPPWGNINCDSLDVKVVDQLHIQYISSKYV